MNRFIKAGIFAVSGMLIATNISAQTKLKYISPNNDGIKDNLIIDFKIKDKSRLSAWSLVIEDAKGNVVRTIGNKVALPTSVSAKNVFKQLGKKKESVFVPPSVIWNGVMENGETAPDGEYFYYFTATDEFGNTTKTGKLSVVVDNTPPSIQITVVPEGMRIFGEGDKIEFTVGQSGSKEDLWSGKVTDASGNTVKNYTWNDSEPGKAVWNGTDDKGIIVQDGVYSYEVTAEDRAGNTAPYTVVHNIIFSAEKPETNIFISSSRYFSIPEKSKISNVSLDVTIPLPRAGSGNSLVRWSVEIVDENGKVCKTYAAENDNPPSRIIFDGKDDGGNYIAEGKYSARVKAEYLNGYKTPVINSPVFVFDATSPSGTVAARETIFSPDGDGNKDLMVIDLTAGKDNGAPVEAWIGSIVNEKDEVIREYKFGQNVPKAVIWNGLDAAGKLSEDGNYNFILSSQDLAGNSFAVKTETPFQLDTSKTEVSLAVSDFAFSPGTASLKKTVSFTPVVKKDAAVSAWNFEIKNREGKTVYTQSGTGKVPSKIDWNGKTSDGAKCEDGIYAASIFTESNNGSKAKADAQPVILDTKAPSVEITSPYLTFSPDGDGRKDEVRFEIKDASREGEWTCVVKDSKGNAVKKYSWAEFPGGKATGFFTWDGTDDSGNVLPDGKYSVTVEALDIAGNSFRKEINSVALDNRETKAYVTAALPGISPVSATGLTVQNFALRLSLDEGIEVWTFDIRDEKGNSVKSWSGKEGEKLPKEFVWDGKDKNEKYCEGNYTGALTINYIKGNYVEAVSTSFICSVTPPVLSLRTSPEFFSPDNDGTDDDLFIKLSGKTTSKIESWSFEINNPESTGRKDAFWKTGGTDKITEQIIWDGLSNTSRERNGVAERVQSAMDYPVKFTVTDSLGMTSTIEDVIRVDILVIRDGENLKIAVPSIIFRSNNADFKTADEVKGSSVTKQQAANNERVLKRVADILKKFPEYTVTVIGHANNITGTEEEETSTENGNIPLIPLSQARADYVMTRLVSYGVKQDHLKAVGKGGREPVVPRSDRENWWKNRRVEFVLHK